MLSVLSFTTAKLLLTISQGAFTANIIIFHVLISEACQTSIFAQFSESTKQFLVELLSLGDLSSINSKRIAVTVTTLQRNESSVRRLAAFQD